jgi:hypothetical protein
MCYPPIAAVFKLKASSAEGELVKSSRVTGDTYRSVDDEGGLVPEGEVEPEKGDGVEEGGPLFGAQLAVPRVRAARQSKSCQA